MRKPLRTALKVLAGTALLFVIAFGVVWFRFRPDAMGRVIPLFEKIDMAAHQPFAAAVGSSVKMSVFEGLPNPFGERDLVKSELKIKQTFKNRGHRFYATEISLTAVDSSSLQAIAVGSAGFVEWSRMKTCGGFHPDWLIRCTSGDGSVHELHLCFGCREAKLYGPGYQLYCDLEPDTRQALKALLGRNRKQRPQTPRQ